MFALLMSAALQVAAAEATPVNPRATDLFDRDPVLAAWAIRRFDQNGDGWLTTFEAQPALAALKALADTDRDGRVSVAEFQAVKARLPTLASSQR
ncbi:hypothetical protein GCM10022280_26530 [Sphingomonas swuensis]|uniref:EF-hand domain-containing protein n=1 Tax=Sphingomonas swuensis TaxID=977800 RepID=A0ABP7TDC3_9SPHN